MVQNIAFNTQSLNGIKSEMNKKLSAKAKATPVQENIQVATPVKLSSLNHVRTTLNESEKIKYNVLVSKIANVKSKNSNGLKPSQQLDLLLKNGKLLAKSPHDKSTTLDNLYNIATNNRSKGLNSTILLTDTLDTLVNPRYVTQTFGDIPNEIKPIYLMQMLLKVFLVKWMFLLQVLVQQPLLKLLWRTNILPNLQDG